MVLDINFDKQEISLGMKQAGRNPWDSITERYKVGDKISGTVRNVVNYGAFVEIEEGIEGLLHVNDISWTKKLAHPSPDVNKGDKIDCLILDIDKERQRISLGMKQLLADPWTTDLPKQLVKGAIMEGKVAKITNFGVFIELNGGLEGLLHVSEISESPAEKPEEQLKAGQDVKVKVINIDLESRKIGLSMKGVPQ